MKNQVFPRNKPTDKEFISKRYVIFSLILIPRAKLNEFSVSFKVCSHEYIQIWFSGFINQYEKLFTVHKYINKIRNRGLLVSQSSGNSYEEDR